MAATPLMQQYYEIKKQNPGCILFFRMGDFFELFEEDAVVASKILGLTLTSRNNGAAGETPLCGFPHHAADRYVPKMVAAGYRIAICEQVEDPKLAKGIVKRDVVEIISAGTAMDETNLNAKEANYLCAYMPAESGDESVFAFADVTTGYLAVSRSSVQAFECEFCRRMPKEVVVAEGCEIPSGVMDIIRSENILITEIPAFLFGAEHGRDVLFSHFKVESLVGLGLDGRDRETAVTGALLQYLMDQKKSELSHFTGLEILNLDDYMTLDPSTLRNLELVRPLNADDYSSTLCSVLDFTVTAMGGRVLKDWVSHPLISVEKIRERQAAVSELVGNPMALDELKESLTSILDMERLMGRVGSGRANARDLAGMGRSLCQASKVARVLSELHSPLFQQFCQVLELAKGRGEELLQNFNDDLPLTVREGGMIREGANVELDAKIAYLRSIINSPEEPMEPRTAAYAAQVVKRAEELRVTPPVITAAEVPVPARDSLFHAKDVRETARIVDQQRFSLYQQYSDMHVPDYSQVIAAIDSAAESLQASIQEKKDSEAAATAAAKAASNHIRELLDNYQSFMDEYITFMAIYDRSDPAQISRADELQTTFVTYVKQIRAIDTKKLTEADQEYFRVVTESISQQMAENNIQEPEYIP